MEHIITSLITAIVTTAAILAYLNYQGRKLHQHIDEHLERQQELEVEQAMAEEAERQQFMGEALREAAQFEQPHVWYEEACPECGSMISFIVPRSYFENNEMEGYCQNCHTKHPVTLGDCSEVERIDG